MMKPDPTPERHSNSSAEVESLRIHRAPTATSAIYRTTSHASGPDAFEPEADDGSRDAYYEAGDEIYERYSPRRKAAVVAVMSFCAFLSPVSSTSVLAATPEVAASFHTTGSVINASNAGYMVFMSFSPIVWGPMSQVFGRWPVSLCQYTLSTCQVCLPWAVVDFMLSRHLKKGEKGGRIESLM